VFALKHLGDLVPARKGNRAMNHGNSHARARDGSILPTVRLFVASRSRGARESNRLRNYYAIIISARLRRWANWFIDC